MNLEEEGRMAMDPRQVIAAILTLSMFAMLGNMIKKDHFDTFQVSSPFVPLFPKKTKEIVVIGSSGSGFSIFFVF